MKSLYSKTFIALDLETTDLDPFRGDIIEISAARYRNGKLQDTFSHLLSISKPLSYLITDLTGITDADLKGQPKLDDVRDAFKEFVGDYPLVGHNLAFDLGFLRAKNIPLNNRVFDTWRLATIAFPELKSHSLQSIVGHLGITANRSHRALDDAKQSAELFYILVERLAAQPAQDLAAVVAFLEDHPIDLQDFFKCILEKRSVATTGQAHAIPTPKRQTAQSLTIDSVLSGVEERKVQGELAQLIAKTLTAGKDTLIEVAPGTGRALAWLAAGVETAHIGTPVLATVLSSTITDALFQYDLKKVRAITGADYLAVLRHPTAYLCPWRLERFMTRTDLDEAAITFVIKVLLWKGQTETGDFAELSLLREEYVARHAVAGHADCQTCLSKTCFARRADERARHAKLIVTDYRRLVTAVQDQHWISTIDALILDDADYMEEAVRQALQQKITQEDLFGILDAAATPGVHGTKADKFTASDEKLLHEFEEMMQQARERAALLFGMIGIFLRRFAKPQSFAIDVVIDEKLAVNSEWQQLQVVGARLIRSVESGITHIDRFLEMHSADETHNTSVAALRDVRQRLVYAAQIMHGIFGAQREEWVSWITLFTNDNGFVLHHVPYTLQSFLKEKIYQNHTVVALSQSIAVAGSAQFLQKRLGLQDASLIIAEKIFDYHAQGLVVASNDLPSVAHPAFFTETAKVLCELSKITPKRMLVLSPSYSSNKTLYQNVKPLLEGSAVELLAQSISGGREKILSRASRADRVVLMGTYDFWDESDLFREGIDIIVVVKLPFANPYAPVTAMQDKKYRNAFFEYSMPKAVLQLRRSFNRMIRTADGRGAFVVLDPRVVTSEYGKTFLTSLPTKNVHTVQSKQIAAEVESWLTREK